MKLLNLIHLKFIAGLFLLALFSCKKDNNSVAEVRVLSPDNTPYAGAVLRLFKESKGTPEGITNAEGILQFNFDPEEKNSIYLVPKMDYGVIGNLEANYIIAGTFTTQQEIDWSAHQIPAAKIGDNKYVDINGDGAINAEDLVLTIPEASKGLVKVTIYLKSQ